MEKLKIITGGFIGLFPTGGATLDYIQYPLGLKLLGHDVYYIEDTGLYPVYQQSGKMWDDASDAVAYLKQTMEFFGLKDKWAYRDVASGKCFGLSAEKVKEICKDADMFINISCSTVMRDEYSGIPKRVLIDSDPMFTQMQVVNEINGLADTATHQMLKDHNYLFSFGENIGREGCRIPTLGYSWMPTRQPVCLDLWQGSKPRKYSFTSILNWSGRKKFDYDNESWGQKDVEFGKFIGLPKKTPATFEVVINPPLNPESHFDIELIRDNGWNVMSPEEVVPGYHEYIDFIKSSLAEFGIAKETYVKSYSGWFSCRSACYLSAGKPVAAEETGWSEHIPAGNGLFSFSNMEEAAEAVDKISTDYNTHSKRAKEIAATFFDSNIVLTEMLNKIN